ncbi:MAG: diaminopimelate epimerase [Spirochaetales bacterium]|nr:diaminopimelate epimerase [Spirochaetales bacterium]
MDVAFLKLHSAGNDFICLDAEKTPPPDERHLAALAKKICRRRTGVGGEGVFCLSRDEEGRILARVYTPEGGEGELCGAALQCAARYAFDTGLAKNSNFRIVRGNTAVPLEIVDSVNVRQDLGAPRGLDSAAELREVSDAVFARPIVIDDHEYACTPVVIDGTHAVLFVAGFGVSPHRLARKIEKHPMFTGGADVLFVRVFSREELEVRAWKKGGTESYACPKTASAGLVAAALNGFAEREALVHLRGGDLFVEWDEASNHVFFTGPAEYVFSGNYYFEE